MRTGGGGGGGAQVGRSGEQAEAARRHEECGGTDSAGRVLRALAAAARTWLGF